MKNRSLAIFLCTAKHPKPYFSEQVKLSRPKAVQKFCSQVAITRLQRCKQEERGKNTQHKIEECNVLAQTANPALVRSVVYRCNSTKCSVLPVVVQCCCTRINKCTSFGRGRSTVATREHRGRKSLFSRGGMSTPCPTLTAEVLETLGNAWMIYTRSGR